MANLKSSLSGDAESNNRRSSIEGSFNLSLKFEGMRQNTSSAYINHINDETNKSSYKSIND